MNVHYYASMVAESTTERYLNLLLSKDNIVKVAAILFNRMETLLYMMLLVEEPSTVCVCY